MKRTVLYKQCVVKSGDSVMVCWLEARVKAGWRVQLSDAEDPERWWLITKVADMALPKEEIKDSHESKNWYKKDFHGKLKGLSIQQHG